MEDTIDLRPYLAALLRYWWLIIGTVAFFIVAALLYYTNLDTYRATAWVAISEPNQRLKFDPRIESIQEADLLLDSYPELALTDEILNQILQDISYKWKNNVSSMKQLRSMLHVEQGASPRLLHLTAETTDPQLAAEIANAWAEIFRNAVNDIYRNPGGRIDFYQQQLAQSRIELQTTQDALAEFQSRNRQTIAQNELKSLTDLQAGYLAAQTTLRLLQDDTQWLRSQLLANSSPAVTIADQLTALSLQLEAYDTQASAFTDQLQIQFNLSGDVTTSDREQQIQMLDELLQTIEGRLTSAGGQLPTLEAQILALQVEYQTSINELDQLTRQRDVAQETYATLARKLDEVRIESQDVGSSVQIVSPATVPTTLNRVNPIYLLGIAIMLGLLLSIFVIIIVTWLKMNYASQD